MSGIASIFIAALALSALAPLTASAGQWANRCNAHGQSGQEECQRAVSEQKAKEAARSSKPTSGDVKNNADRLKADIGAQKADLADAQKKCEDAKKNCEKQCDQEKKDAKPHAQNQKDPLYPEAKPDYNGQVDKEKNSACTAPIMAMIGQLANGQSPLPGQGQEAGNTSGNSTGMPPIPPIPPKDDKKDDKKATDDPTANKPMVCGSDSSTTKYSDCNDYYVNKCSGNMGQDGCDQFISRYCGPMNGSGSSGGTTTNTDSNFLTGVTKNPATANLVADKQGEGMGSSFCGKANGYRFCQASGRESCPSCQNVSSWSTAYSSDNLKTAQNACPSDPIFSDPAIVAQMNQGATTPKDPDKPNDTKTMSTSAKSLSGGSGGTGSGSAGGKSGSGKASLGNDEGIAEGVATGPGSLDLNSGSGGGGGYHSEDEEKNEDSKNHMGLQSVSRRTPAGNLVSNSSDVANQYGPNLFSISTSTYKALCVRGRFLHCRER